MAPAGRGNRRRTVLREREREREPEPEPERERPGAANIGLIDTVVRYSLDAGYHSSLTATKGRIMTETGLTSLPPACPGLPPLDR